MGAIKIHSGLLIVSLRVVSMVVTFSYFNTCVGGDEVRFMTSIWLKCPLCNNLMTDTLQV